MAKEKPKPEDLGAGRYRVTEPFVYRGQQCKPGDEIDMSDAGAGAHWDKIDKVGAEPTAKPAAKEPKAHTAHPK